MSGRYRGAHRSRRDRCINCSGRGLIRIRRFFSITCPHCRGFGRVTYYRPPLAQRRGLA